MHQIQPPSVTMPEQRLGLKHLLYCAPEGAQPKTWVPMARRAETQKWKS